MKYIYNITIILILSLLPLLNSCQDEAVSSDTTPPAKISNVEFTALNGGGYFTYTIPADDDFLYVRGEYEIDNGTVISKTSSVYADTLFIEGLGQVKPYEIKLYSVDRENNHSEPVVMQVTPLIPTTAAILETVQVQPGFSSLVVDWENEQRLTVQIFVTVTIGDRSVNQIYSSNLLKDRFIIPNLTGVPHQVKVHVRDAYDNKTEDSDFGSITPLIDAPITKQPWEFLRDQLLFGDKWDYSSDPSPFNQKPFPEYSRLHEPDSFKNAPMSHVEGRIEKFWDNEYDYEPVQNLNYFNTGQLSYPFSYYIDMGREIVASRFKIWQRNSWGMLYGGENVEIFELWVSNDQTPEDGVLEDWEYVGRYRIVKPSSVIEANNEARAGHEFMLYPDNPRFTKPFRYLRFKAIKQFGGGNSGCMSELTLYGTEANGTIIEDPTVLTGPIPGWE